MAKEHDGTPPFDGLLDLDEPEIPVEPRYHDVPPPPDWSEEDQLIIDVSGYIHVRGGRFFDSRVVGRVRGEDGEATIGALVARFEELEERLKFLEREMKSSRNLVRNLKSMRSYVHWVEGADAIGDFVALLERAYRIIDRLETKVGSSRGAKVALVAEAEALADSTAWKATGEAMDRLMVAWKKAGSAGGDEDEALWQRFRGARSTFFERRSANMAEIQRARTSGREAKEALIARAEALSESTDWDSTSDEMQALLEEWKNVGSVGRKTDDELWERFHAARDPFFERRKAHFAQQRREQSRREREQAGPRKTDRRALPPRRDSVPAGGRGRTSSTGTLHASLAEILGPMSELLAKNRPTNEDDKPRSKGQGRRKTG